jgi:hypothetical protein
MKTRSLILATLLASVVAASGRSHSFALMRDISNLGRFTKMYHDQRGTYPTTWSQFEELFGATGKLGGVVDPRERFVFVGPQVLLQAYPTEERILLISREPFRPPTEEMIPVVGIYYKTVGDRVYVAAVQQGENVFVRKITPERAAKIFGEAGAKLPEPSGLGTYPHERAHDTQIIALWLGASAACFAGIGVIVVRKKRRSESGPRE